MTLFINGNIYINKDKVCTSMLIEDNRIVKVSNQIIKAEQHNVIDLENKTVLPGFIDAHLHLYFMAELLDSVNLQASRSFEDIQKAMKGNEDKLYGWGFNESSWEEPILPNRYDLDTISKTKPIYILRSCFHICIVNTRVLEMMGISKDSIPIVEGGEIEIDHQGNPTGVFKENARDLILDYFSLHTSKDAINRRLNHITDLALSHGITTVQTNDIKIGKPGNLQLESAYYHYTNEQKKIRIIHQISVQDDKEFEERIKSNWALYPDTIWHQYGPLKLFMDGSLGARTAKLIRPYNDHTTTGIQSLSQEKLDYYLNQFEGQIVAHAIGDQALKVLLNSYINKAEPHNPKRHAVIHLQVAQEKDLQRMVNHKIPAITQPVFWKSDKDMALNRLGKERMDFSYAYQLHDEMGIKVAYSSDAPVEGLSVLDGIKEAMELGISLTSAIDHYTIDAAWMAHQETNMGRIDKDFLADFVILDKNIFEEGIEDAKIVQTYVNGESQYNISK